MFIINPKNSHLDSLRNQRRNKYIRNKALSIINDLLKSTISPRDPARLVRRDTIERRQIREIMV